MKLRHAVSKVKTWVATHRKALGFSLLGLAVLSVSVQLVYPYGHALPLASVAGESVGMKQRPAITLAIQDSFADATVRLRSGDHEFSEPLRNLGATVDADEMANHAVSYPLLFRFVPFSIFWYQPGLERYQLQFDETRLGTMSERYSKKLSVEAVNAGIKLDDGNLDVTEAKNGHQVTTDELKERLVSTKYNWGETVIDVNGTTLEPRVSNASIADIRQQAERILDQKITVSVVGKKTFTPDRPMIASWLSLHNGQDGTVRLSANKQTMNKYVATVAEETTTKPTETVVSLLDGKETARKNGTTGRGISTDTLVNELVKSIEYPQGAPVAISLERQPLKPPVSYKRSYTNSQRGLEIYVKDMADSGDINIAVRQLGGAGWTADGDSAESIASASTYKPMLMLKVFDDIDDRELKWKDKIGNETVQDCFESIIVRSSNECAEALIKRYGVFELTEYLHGRGFSKGTGFTFKETTQTTAADLAKLMVGIEDGSLIKKKYRDMMLEKMGRQIFRQGIPAGTTAKVYDKVGFLWDYLHDAAIVDHPEGRYVLVVMTKGESWQKIADITRDIEAILYGDGLSR